MNYCFYKCISGKCVSIKLYVMKRFVRKISALEDGRMEM